MNIMFVTMEDIIMNRTHHNNALGSQHVGQNVCLVGWVAKRRNFGQLVFIDLRDREGITQLVFNEQLSESIKDVRNEYILEVTGEVVLRQDPNPKLTTGAIEVKVTTVTIINDAHLSPLIIADETDALEETRLKYRYLDLRRPIMQKKLRDRAKIVRSIRNYLDEQGFIDIETPLLTKSTPEGSREYLVPSRVHPGEFYALAQSPQIFKQLLMVAGFERYYQVARCFRDEDLRADRQLDFTQVDIEASFLNEQEFQTIMEGLVQSVMKDVLQIELSLPLTRLSYEDAMNRFGSDKPDNRFGLELQDVTNILTQCPFPLFEQAFKNKDGVVKALVVKKGAQLTRKQIDQYSELVKKHGASGLISIKYVDASLQGSVVKYLDGFSQELISALNLQDQDLVLMVADRWERACNSLGALRLALRDALDLVESNTYSFLWVLDFPMFEEDTENHRFVARHHPFTRPQTNNIDEILAKPLAIKAHAYDLVLNGFEIAGGSMRIYDQQMQKAVFSLLGFTNQQIEERFGFFVDAFKYGTPPHGGIAFGLDRLAMVLTQSESLRDVIAFPKNASARCPITEAPTTVDSKQLTDLHIQLKSD
jgi:aspartyl-tRNA synthetase